MGDTAGATRRPLGQHQVVTAGRVGAERGVEPFRRRPGPRVAVQDDLEVDPALLGGEQGVGDPAQGERVADDPDGAVPGRVLDVVQQPGQDLVRLGGGIAEDGSGDRRERGGEQRGPADPSAAVALRARAASAASEGAKGRERHQQGPCPRVGTNEVNIPRLELRRPAFQSRGRQTYAGGNGVRSQVGCGTTGRWDWLRGWLEPSIPTRFRSMPSWSARLVAPGDACLRRHADSPVGVERLVERVVPSR